jgi:hypothetical protein
MAQEQQSSASGASLGEHNSRVCKAGIWRMSDNISEATRSDMND